MKNTPNKKTHYATSVKMRQKVLRITEVLS